MLLLDIDNTIADDLWRQRLIRPSAPNRFDMFHAYHVVSLGDPHANIEEFRHRSDIIFLTARPRYYKGITKEWLNSRGLFGLLCMRDNADHRPSLEFKRETLLWLLEEGHSIDAAFDDREDIVSMYRAEGITAHRLFIHDQKEFYR